jgi:hypothetical protein
MRSSVRQVAAMKDQVRFLLAQIGQHSIKGRQVTVNI